MMKDILSRHTQSKYKSKELDDQSRRQIRVVLHLYNTRVSRVCGLRALKWEVCHVSIAVLHGVNFLWKALLL